MQAKRLNLEMANLQEIIIESNDNHGLMQDYIAKICFEINLIKCNNPEVKMENLVSGLELLIKHCDGVLLDSEENKKILDSSRRDCTILGV